MLQYKETEMFLKLYDLDFKKIIKKGLKILIIVYLKILEQCKDMDHQENEKKLSPLHILAYYGHKEALKFLLKNNFDPEVRDVNGRTPLDLACFQGEILCVETLINYGANYETSDYVNERTPIHAAAYNNNIECLKYLSLVAKEDEKNDLRFNYEKINTESFRNEKLANIRDKHFRTPLMYAVEQGHLNTISFFINEMGADVLAYDNKHRTALHRAVIF